MSKVHFANLVLDIVDGWLDITDDLPEGSPPTLARSDGVGVLQFSVAKYQDGELPRIDCQRLKEMLLEFFLTHQLGTPTNFAEKKGKNNIVSGRYLSSEESIEIWYVSNGEDVAIVSYVAQETHKEDFDREFQDAKLIVESIEFETP